MATYRFILMIRPTTKSYTIVKNNVEYVHLFVVKNNVEYVHLFAVLLKTLLEISL
jgi:hypothetical protein